MISVIIHTATEELLQICQIRVKDELPEVTANIVFEANGLDPADYTVRSFDVDYTTNKFKKFCYIENLTPYNKSLISAQVDKKEITADGVDKATISNCPEGALVYFNKELAGTVGSDGVVEVTSTVAKKVALTLEKFGYQTERIVINAT